MGLFDRLDRRLDKLADQLGELIGPDDVRAHVELGQAYLTAGNLEGASRELASALELRPDHARALYLLGRVHERRGDRKGARDLYVQAGLREGFVEPHLALGQLALVDGDLDVAADSYRRALDQGGDLDARADAYRGLGLSQLRAGRYDRAVRELRKAVANAPDDPTAQTLLGRALLGKGDLDTARLCLERATRREPAPPEAWAALGQVLAALGRPSDAEKAFRGALAGISALPATPDYAEAEVASRLGLARLDREAGKLDDARIGALAALDRAPGNLDLLAELGRVARALGTPAVALDAFDRALAGEAPPLQDGRRSLADPRSLLSEALSLALASGLDDRAGFYARALLERRPDDAPARAALAIIALAAGEPERAEAELALASGGDASLEHRLARAALALHRGDRPLALAELRQAARLAPEDPRPRSRYAALHARADPLPGDVPALLAAAHRLASSSPELAELAPALGRLRESLDRPLVVTVMGEFNAGKSTFVNAFLGEEVAPMGITPTTATVNLLKYGAERKGRVHYRDEHTRELAWADVPAFLRNLRDDEARQIRLVELLYPLETLQRINVVDTPGLNSIHAEHEEVARRYIEEADAVIWLFSVDQAAKASEGEALDRIATQGRKVLGVVNKIDRVDEADRAQILAHIQRSLGDRLETIVPVSARAALAARKSGDATALAASNYPTLDATLEARFFGRARQIQRRIAVLRALALLEDGTRHVEALAAAATTDSHDQALVAARADARAIAETFLPAERRRLLEAADEALLVCAREVLDFVRPRRGLFGGNEATPADRDFLLTLLEERLALALSASRDRIVVELARSLTLVAGLAGGPAQASQHPLASELDARVFDRYRAFFRGWLRGGAVAQFFAKELPRLELTEQGVRRALERAVPFDDDTLEEELRQPLRGYCASLFAELASAIEQRRAAVLLARFELEARLLSPLRALTRLAATEAAAEDR